MYGLIVTASILISAWYAEKELEFEKKDTEPMWAALLWVLVCGLIGARLFHVFDYWNYYLQNPELIPQLWQGGLGIFGGIAGGLAGLALFGRKNRLSRTELLKLIDLGALVLPLGQFIGRWANYFNQEVYGLPSTLPWAIYIPFDKRLDAVLGFDTFHPLFLYESLGALVIFFILFSLKHLLKKRVRLLDGDLLLVYLLTYGFLRFILEPLRIVHWGLGNFNVVSSLSLALMIFSLLVLIFRKDGQNRETSDNTRTKIK